MSAHHGESGFERVLGDVEGPVAGPTVVLTGGMHGNEPAGTLAARELVEALGPLRAQLRGRVVALGGNLGALARGQRYLRRDLNRRWTEEALAGLRARPRHELHDEDREQVELAERFEGLERGGRPMAFLDLHTTSGPSAPFVCFADTLTNRSLALGLGVPAILGLEEIIDHSMLGYCADRGHGAVAFEAGQHHDPETRRRHVSAAWLFLVGAGVLDARAVPDLDSHRARLRDAAAGRPAVVEIRHRHLVRDGDGFEMLPGFVSFQRVDEGAVVARDRHGELRAPLGGWMLMPRYQPQGEDGYFLAREVRPFWLRVSAALRRVGAHRLVSRLPGVEADGTDARLLVDPKIARSRAVEVMHLCGYKRRADEGGKLVFSRRTG